MARSVLFNRKHLVVFLVTMAAVSCRAPAVSPQPGSTPELLQTASPAASATTPVVSSTPACPPIKREVTVSVEPSIVDVGDILTVTCQSSGIAGLAKVRLYIGSQAAAAPELEIYDAVTSPLVEVLPSSEVSTLGNGTFVLAALRSGSFGVYVTVYGDAFFYEDGETCLRATHFETLYSNIVPVTIIE